MFIPGGFDTVFSALQWIVLFIPHPPRNIHVLVPCLETPELKDVNVLCKIQGTALAGIAQWTECRPVNQSITGLSPS